MTRAHTPTRRLRDIKPGRYISTPSIAKGYPLFYGQIAGNYALIWKSEKGYLSGLPWTDMACLGLSAKEVGHA